MLTLQRIKKLIDDTVEAINKFERLGSAELTMFEASENDFDIDDSNTEYFSVGKVKIQLADIGLYHMAQ